jgi:hypothetical protein
MEATRNHAERLHTEAERLLILLAWGIFGLTAVWAIFFVPMTADEANIYHVLACYHYPFASYNTFINVCDHQNDITLFGISIAKPFVYGGVLPSILYAPLYFLLHAQSGQYWLGLLFLLGFAHLLSRETAKPYLTFPVLLAFFPFTFQFVHDMGPVKFEFLAFCLGGILLRKLLAAQQPAQTIYVALLAILVFWATEDKVFFLYLLPSFTFFCIALIADGDWNQLLVQLRQKRPAILMTVLLSATGIVALLFSVNNDGTYYLQSLIDYINTTQQNTMPLEARGLHAAKIIEFLFTFLLLWPYYAHRIYDVLGTYYNLWGEDPVINYVLNGLTVVFFVLWFYMGLRAQSFSLRMAPRTVLLLLSFLSTVLVFLAARNVWAGHHFIFLWLPLMLLFQDFICTLETRGLTAILSLFFFINVLSVLTLTHTRVLPEDLGDRDAILAYFNDPVRSSQSIVNYSTWGLYNIHALYGSQDQLVTYTDQITRKKAEKLLEISQTTGRRIYNVCIDAGWGKPIVNSALSPCSKTYLDSVFGNKLDFQERLSGLPTWRVYEGIPR